ncbi:AI-2E family transporter [Hymenobacter sp. UV11]|uniref:AI-2E family transporter n=1 Tax=Hymenobacter sp. UV11 TaxID=1849735 RepID=UPI00105F62D2|nr:AI-2E family transporter [Hymenobacter sp. UV11]TDN37572.1 AI-2E family transporter [Hymenobacter sp. UV11]TFZ68768.1 AI-2E family transporter [Hymenobacter sp. UV11]
MPHTTEANIYSPRQRFVLLIVTLVVLGMLALFGLLEYLTAFLGAGILYVVLRPWFTALVHQRRWNRTFVTVLLLVFAIVVLVIPFFALSSLLINRVTELAKHPEQLLSAVQSVERKVGMQVTQETQVRQLLQQGAARVSQWIPTLASSVLNVIVIVGLMLFTLYYLFMQEEAFLLGLKRYLPFREKTMDELSISLKNNVNANVLGQGIVALVQGILTGVTLWIFDVPDSLFWTVVAFFMAFIPVLGTPLVWGPAAIYQFAQGHNGQGLGILLVGVIVIVNIDNLLRIWLAKYMGDIHPWVTLVGLTLGVGIFGIVGLVIGPLLLSYLIVLMQVFARENVALRHLVPDGVVAKAERNMEAKLRQEEAASEVRRTQ